MENISKHITWKEAVQSHTASKLNIDNTPTDEHLENMKLVAENIFEKIRVYFNKPIGIHSFYRSAALNKAIKGAKGSQHLLGQAIDIDGQLLGGITNKEIFDYIINNLDFDQIIWEGGTDEEPDWIHVSYKKEGNRNKITRMKIVDGKQIYEPYIK